MTTTHGSGKLEKGQPDSPTARQPDSPTARQPDSPTARQPDSPTARQPDSPTARQPDSPTARQPDSPTARQLEGAGPASADDTASRVMAVYWRGTGILAGLGTFSEADTRDHLTARILDAADYPTAFMCREIADAGNRPDRIV